MKLFLKGERCHSEKCAIESRNFVPGQHGKDRKAKLVGYGLQLREKQKVRRIYGVLEAQFRNTFEKAAKQKGITGENLLGGLERRLDSVIYRMGFATSRSQARQIVRHGHIDVNGRKCQYPFVLVKPGEEIAVRESSKNNADDPRRPRCHRARASPAWMDVDRESLKGKVNSIPAARRTGADSDQRTAHRRTVQQVISEFRSSKNRPARIEIKPGRYWSKNKSMFKGFQKPKRLVANTETLTERYGQFTAQPFQRGFGTTIGNSLRRVLLSSIEGAAITAIRIEGVDHEFSPIPGVVEDATDIILNLKQVPFKVMGEGMKTVRLTADKAGEVFSGQIQTDADVEVLDRNLHIATVSEGGKLDIEMRLKTGRGYVSADKNFDEDLAIGFIPIDSVHSPVRKVNFAVEAARLGQMTDYDKLTLEVWSNGAISPQDAIGHAAKLLKDHMTIFINFESGEPDHERGEQRGDHEHDDEFASHRKAGLRS